MTTEGGVQYSKIAEIKGPLVVVDDVENAAFDELVEIETNEGELQYEADMEEAKDAHEDEDDEDDDDVAPIGSNVGISRSDVQERLRREVKDQLRQLQEKADRADESDD